MLNRVGVLTVLVFATATACSGSGSDADETAPESGEPAAPAEPADSAPPVDSGPASVEAFCTQFVSLQVEQPESYVGSARHLADIDGLLAVAPDGVAADVTTFRDYVSSGAIDAEADPESTLTANWPDDVTAAITNTQTFAADNC